MFEDGYVVPGEQLSRIHTWQFDDPVLHAFLVGTLATLLAYQGTALLIDLFLGWKKRGEVAVADLYTLLRTEDLSFRLICQIFRKGSPVDSKQLEKEEESKKDTESEENDYRLKASSMIKLFVLLAGVPGINLLAIFLTLETDTTVSFREADFGGISYGVRPNGSGILQTRDVSADCTSLVTKLENVAQPMASFFLCVRSRVPEIPAADDPVTKVIVEAQADGEVEFTVINSADYYLGSRRLEMQTGGLFYRIPHSITPEQAKELVKRGGNVLSEGCTRLSGKDETPPVVVTQEGRRIRAEQSFTCKEDKPVTMEASLIEMYSQVDAIEDSSLLVAKVEDAELGLENSFEFESGEDLPFYKWRGSYASFLVLSILVACFGAARLLVMLFTHNDIHVGIELIIKDQLGLKFGDSMLQNASSVQYEGVSFLGRESE